MKDYIVALMGVMKTAYPRFYSNMGSQELEDTVALWSEMLKDIEPQTLTMAVKALIATNPFPPTIAEIRNKVLAITGGGSQLSEMEAWALVKKACQNGIYGSVKEFGKLPPMVQKAVGSANMIREWAQMDVQQLDTVVQSNFMRSYKTVSIREQEFAQLPETVQRFVSGKVVSALKGLDFTEKERRALAPKKEDEHAE